MISNILSNIICSTFEKECPFSGINNPRTKALKIIFNHNVVFWYDGSFEAKFYPKTDMIIWGPMRYIGVFTRKMNETQWGEWECLSYHDSCWKTDGVDRWIFQNREDLSTLGDAFSHWYSVIDLNHIETEMFKFLTKRA